MKLNMGLWFLTRSHIYTELSFQIRKVGNSIKEMVMEGHIGYSKAIVNVLSFKLGVRYIHGFLVLLS